jgi:hypothetical protein
MSDVSCRVERPSVPVAWLDTSILIKRAQIKAGLALCSQDRERISFLHNRVYELVRSGQLICPKANQSSEVWRRTEEMFDAIGEYSLGVRTRHPGSVQERQERRAMRCFASGDSVVELPYGDLFASDPVETLRENLARPFFIGVVETPNDSLIQDFKRRRGEIHQGWEALRRRNLEQGMQYPAQLEVELEGEISVV